PVHVDLRARAAGVHNLWRERAIQLSRDVAGRASNGQDRLGPFAHPDQVFTRTARARKMEVGEFADGVARALVDRTGDLAALDVGDADVHIRGGDRGRERFVPVAD